MFSEQLKNDLKNPWLRTILTFIGITVTVNAGFIIYAFIVPPNLVVEDYYERGKTYFHDQKERTEAAPTAWRLQLLLTNKIALNETSTCRLYVVDHLNKPVDSGRATLTAYRPNDASYDFEVELKATDKGTFAAPITFPLPGHWDLIARIESNGKRFDTAQRIFVQK